MSAAGSELLERLLARTSRTFALSVPLLPEPLRREVTVAYLLLRIADTLEDEASWPAAERIEALERLAALLRGTECEPAAVAAVLRGAEVAHEGYAELLREAAHVFAAYRGLECRSRSAIAAHVLRTIEGMAHFLARAGVLASLAELRAYCYAVAGLVGELCTALFAARCATLAPCTARLARLAGAFGEGLQLVNILKDEAVDRGCGRSYVPPGIDRARLFALAAADLRRAIAYVGLLERHGAHSGIVAFNSLNLLLALATLPQLRARGPGTKIDHEQVRAAHARLLVATGRGESVMPLLRRAADALGPARPRRRSRAAGRCAPAGSLAAL